MEKPDMTFNALIIISSMPDGDKGAEELLTLINRKSQKLMGSDFASIIHVKTRTDFDACMSLIKFNVKAHGLKPLLHFDLHGTTDEKGNGTGLSFIGGGNILWADLAIRLRELNIRIGNNLFISLAVCYGGWLLEIYNLQLPCPFYGYIGPEDKMNIEDVNACFIEFYDALFDYGSVIEAIHAMKLRLPQHANEFVYINCEKYWRLIEEMSADPEQTQRELNRMTSLYKQHYPQLTVDEFQSILRDKMSKIYPDQFNVWKRVFFHQEFDRSQFIKD